MHTVNNQFFPPLIFLNIFSQFKMIENDLDQSNLSMPLHLKFGIFVRNRTMHSGPKNFKMSRPKKLMKSNNSISQKIFWPKSIYYNFKNGQKSIFELGKSLKRQKMQFHQEFFFIYSLLRVLLPGLFLIFWPAVTMYMHTY